MELMQTGPGDGTAGHDEGRAGVREQGQDRGFEIFEPRLSSLNPNWLSRKGAWNMTRAIRWPHSALSSIPNCIFKHYYPGLQHNTAESTGFQLLQPGINPQAGAPAPITMLDQADTQPDKFGVSGLITN